MTRKEAVGPCLATVVCALSAHKAERHKAEHLPQTMDALMFKRRRPTEQALLLSHLDAVLHELRPLCGALLVGKRRGMHAPAMNAGWTTPRRRWDC